MEVSMNSVLVVCDFFLFICWVSAVLDVKSRTAVTGCTSDLSKCY